MSNDRDKLRVVDGALLQREEVPDHLLRSDLAADVGQVLQEGQQLARREDALVDRYRSAMVVTKGANQRAMNDCLYTSVKWGGVGAALGLVLGLGWLVWGVRRGQ